MKNDVVKLYLSEVNTQQIIVKGILLVANLFVDFVEQLMLEDMEVRKKMVLFHIIKCVIKEHMIKKQKINKIIKCYYN